MQPLSGFLWWVTTVSLCISWVQVPLISTAALLAVSAASFASIVVSRRSVDRAFVASLIVLVSFCVMFYGGSWAYDFMTAPEALKLSGSAVGAYVTGHVLGRRTSSDSPRLFLTLLGVAAAFTALVALSVWNTPTLEIIENGERRAAHFFVPGDRLSATVLAAMSSLGICLAPVVLFGRRGVLSRKKHLLLLFTVAVIVGLAVYSNITLQNRSPFIALFVSIALGAYLAGRSSSKLRVLGVLVAVAAAAVLIGSDVTALGVHGRFAEQGLASPRYEAWKLMAAHLLDEPLGGRAFDIRVGYVHNAWLDVAYDTGLAAMLLLIAFHIRHARVITRLVRSPIPVSHKLAVVAVLVAFGVSFAIEPVLQFGGTYFAVSCFVLGFLAATRLGTRLPTRRPSIGLVPFELGDREPGPPPSQRPSPFRSQ